MDEEDKFYLPHDIILNVLVRLPVKSLIRFRCVCKDWNDLLKTYSFIKEHLDHTSHLRGPSLLLQWGYSTMHILDSDKKTLMPLNARSINIIPFYPFRLIGSSNGLFCLQLEFNGSIVLWNPATREVQYVPETNKNNLWHIGFGFSRVVNDYKIVRIYDSRHVEVYSLSTGSWKKVRFSDDNLLEGVSFFGSFVATDEAIYWFAYNDQMDILSFDTATEVFTLIPRPAEPHVHRNIRLIVYENKIALFSGIELWVMEEATSGESVQRWNKTKVLGSPRLPYLHLMTIWENEAIFEFEPSKPEFGIYLFNLSTNKLKEITMARAYGISGAFNYVESIVPIGNKNSRTSS